MGTLKGITMVALLCLLPGGVSCRGVSRPADAGKDAARPWNDSIEAILLPQTPKGMPEQLIYRKSYVCSYNSENRCANWSAWVLTREHANGPYRRRDVHIEGYYLEDEEGVAGRQRLSDWNKVEGYDHGHLCPSGDNKWDLEAMYETYFLSNMCVQNRMLNQGPWENLESRCREWAKRFGELYIVTGPVFYDKEHKTTGTGLHVPDAFFKVVLCLKGTPKAIAFLYDNITPQPRENLDSHVYNIDEIEALTGLDFFRILNDNLENALESGSDIKEWRVY